MGALLQRMVECKKGMVNIFLHVRNWRRWENEPAVWRVLNNGCMLLVVEPEMRIEDAHNDNNMVSWGILLMFLLLLLLERDTLPHTLAYNTKEPASKKLSQRL